MLKPSPPKKAPAGNEMDEMMKEAQKELDNMSPDDKKMIEGMGVKMPSMNGTPQITDQQMLNASNETESIVPKKDPVRITKVSSTNICEAGNVIRNKFLTEANTLMEQRERVYLNYANRQTDNLLYYRKYTKWPDEYAWTTLMAQISWLTQVSRQVVSFRNESQHCQYAAKDDNPKVDSLQNFDDVARKYISTTYLGCFTITSQCSRLIGEFRCGGIDIKMKQNDETDRFSGSVFVGTSKSVSVGKGPASAEAELTAAVGIELAVSGMTDLVG